MTHDHTRGRSFHCRMASPTDPQVEKNLCPIFLDFVQRFCFELDFRSYSETERWYSRLKLPVSQIPDSLIAALISRNGTHEHWVKPTSNRITDRHHVLALGTIGKEDEFEGLMHLRIVKGNEAYIWIATQTPLNATESIEASMWLRAVSRLTLLQKSLNSLSDLVYAPVPIHTHIEQQKVTCELVEGPLLRVPDYASRTEVLLKTHGTGWRFDELTPAQQDLVSPLLQPGANRQHPKEFFNQAFLACIAAMAKGLDAEGCAQVAADSLTENLTYYKHKPERALEMGKRLVKSIRTRTPLVQNSYGRSSEVIETQRRKASAEVQAIQSISGEERLARFWNFMDECS